MKVGFREDAGQLKSTYHQPGQPPQLAPIENTPTSANPSSQDSSHQDEF
jgi:hypothetical protein